VPYPCRIYRNTCPRAAVLERTDQILSRPVRFGVLLLQDQETISFPETGEMDEGERSQGRNVFPGPGETAASLVRLVPEKENRFLAIVRAERFQKVQQDSAAGRVAIAVFPVRGTEKRAEGKTDRRREKEDFEDHEREACAGRKGCGRENEYREDQREQAQKNGKRAGGGIDRRGDERPPQRFVAGGNTDLRGSFVSDEKTYACTASEITAVPAEGLGVGFGICEETLPLPPGAADGIFLQKQFLGIHEDLPRGAAECPPLFLL